MPPGSTSGGATATAVQGPAPHRSPVFIPGAIPPYPEELGPRLAWIIRQMMKYAAWQGCQDHAFGRLLPGFHHRLAKVVRLITAIAVQVAAGTYRVRSSPTPGQTPRKTPPPRPAPEQRLPTRYAWLSQLMPEVNVYAGCLERLLDTPEMVAVLQAAPAARRYLLPLCRALGVRHPIIKGAPWARPARPPKPPPPRP